MVNVLNKIVDNIKNIPGLIKETHGALSSEAKKNKLLRKLINKKTEQQYEKEGWGSNSTGEWKTPEFNNKAWGEQNLTKKKIRDKVISKYSWLK